MGIADIGNDRLMKSYRSYVDRVEERVDRALRNERRFTKQEISHLLGSEPAVELRKAMDIESRRGAGAFFTSPVMARLLVGGPSIRRPASPVVFDAACGAGDLLLAVARRLPVLGDITSTLNFWGEHLHGVDLCRDFVRLAKLRLVALALSRGVAPKAGSCQLKCIFPQIHCADGLRAKQSYSNAKWIIMNPPYHQALASASCEWAHGKVTCAALFLETALLNADSGTQIMAILPDVLRTGSRYAKWRDMVERHADIETVKALGMFDKYTDVHVFILKARKTELKAQSTTQWWVGSVRSTVPKVGDVFDVHVGSVVPFRDAKRGPLRSYIHAQAVPSWGRVKRVSETRRFGGTVFKAPFVAIRRTSRPEDTFRAVGTLVSGTRQVAVENHLIVCQPRDGRLHTCRLLLKALKGTQTNVFLNKRIRCRHLTVVAVRELPLLDWPA